MTISVVGYSSEVNSFTSVESINRPGLATVGDVLIGVMNNGTPSIPPNPGCTLDSQFTIDFSLNDNLPGVWYSNLVFFHRIYDGTETATFTYQGNTAANLIIVGQFTGANNLIVPNESIYAPSVGTSLDITFPTKAINNPSMRVMVGTTAYADPTFTQPVGTDGFEIINRAGSPAFIGNESVSTSAAERTFSATTLSGYGIGIFGVDYLLESSSEESGGSPINFRQLMLLGVG